MAGISSLGIGSGLDLNGLVDKLMEAERLPLKALDTKEADFQAKLTAYGTLKGAYASFETAARGLASPIKFNTAKASAADETVLTATASSIAKPGTHTIEVSQLAQSHKIASGTFDDPAASIGTGTLTIDFGTYDSGANSFTTNADKTALSIDIDASNNSLTGIRDAINEAEGGVTASIINDGTGYRLVVSSNDSGKTNSLRILVDDAGDGIDTDTSGLSQLAYDPTAAVGSGKNLEQKMAGLNAELQIDGIAISKSSNLIGDALSGVTLNLLKTTDAPTTLTVERDTSGVKTSVEEFVTAYNELAATIKELGGYDMKTQEGGLLLGDATLRSMQNQVRTTLSQRLAYADGGVQSLSDIGVSFQRDGTLALNGSKLDAVLADPAKNLAPLFATMGVPSDSLVGYLGASDATQAGRYEVNITQIATRGTATGSIALNADDTKTTIVSGVNDALSLKLNGLSATITLTAGTYTRDAMAAELQTRINTVFASFGHSVSTTHNAGVLTVASTRYGSTSNIEFTGGNALATLFGTASSTTGVDVAGEIGGVEAVGAGQVLTGAGNATDLRLLIEGGNVGLRGTVGFERGIGWQLDRTIAAMLETGGTLESRTEGIGSSIGDIASRRSALERRLEDIEARYRKQFSALDQLVASMQQTSQYLTQQLANLPSTSGE